MEERRKSIEERRKSQEFTLPVGATEESVLLEMLDRTNHTLSEGEAVLKEARLSVQQCKEKSEKLEIAHGKLELIAAELDKQFHVVSQLIVQLRMRDDGFQRTVSKFDSRQSEINEGLEQIFTKLKNRKINFALLTTPNTYTNLYDYVDSASIQRLRKQTRKEIEQMKETQLYVGDLIKGLEEAMVSLSMRYKTAEIRVDFRLAYPTEKTSMQLNEVNAMAAVMLAITAHSDHITHLLRIKETRTQHIDLAALQRKTEQLPPSLSTLKNRLQRILQISKQIDERYDKYAAAFRQAVALFDEFQRFSELIRQSLRQLDEAEAIFEERRVSACSLFEELSNLTTWYDLFNTAYEELLLEVDRRHVELRRQQDIVEAYQDELEYWYQAETQKRENFYDFYGRYLPQSLCPAIMETANRYEIFPAHFTTRLPELQLEEDAAGDMETARTGESPDSPGMPKITTGRNKPPNKMYKQHTL